MLRDALTYFGAIFLWIGCMFLWIFAVKWFTLEAVSALWGGITAYGIAYVFLKDK